MREPLQQQEDLVEVHVYVLLAWLALQQQGGGRLGEHVIGKGSADEHGDGNLESKGMKRDAAAANGNNNNRIATVRITKNCKSQIVIIIIIIPVGRLSIGNG